MPHLLEKPFSEKSLSKRYVLYFVTSYSRISVQPEQTGEKGLLKVLQGWKILSVDRTLHNPRPNRCRRISGLLRWPEKPTKPGPKLAPKFYKFRPENFPEICTEIRPKNLGLCFTIRKISQSIFVPPSEKFHTPFWKFCLG